jgi:hypothetical protein
MNEQNVSNSSRPQNATVKMSNIPVIDRIYKLNNDLKESGKKMPGHYIPDIWHHVFLDKRGRPYHLAMEIFAEVLFKHQPRQVDQHLDDGNVVAGLNKYFKNDRYQFNRGEMANRLLISHLHRRQSRHKKRTAPIGGLPEF